MSQEEPGRVIRTVTAPYRSRADSEMSIVGLLLGLGMVIVLIPLLPFILVIWVLSKLASLGSPE